MWSQMRSQNETGHHSKLEVPKLEVPTSAVQDHRPRRRCTRASSGARYASTGVADAAMSAEPGRPLTRGSAAAASEPVCSTGSWSTSCTRSRSLWKNNHWHTMALSL